MRIVFHRFRAAAIVTAALALQACASPSSTPIADRDCFRAMDIHGYQVLDNQHIRVVITPQREYDLTLGQPVWRLSATDPIQIHSDVSFICVGPSATVRLIGGEPQISYLVTHVARAPQGS